MKITLNSILILLAFLLNNSTFSQDVEFVALTSHKEVKTGDRFQIEFRANGKFSNFKAPNLSNFRVLSGPNQSTNMSWVNGKTTSNVSFSYVLMAVKEGTFKIGPAVAAFGNAAHKTNSISIKVSKGVNVQQNGSQQKTTQQNASDDLYIKATASKRNIYQGEQIIVTYQLYTRVNIAGNELVKNANLNGFWSQEIDFGQSQWKQEVIGGYRWNIATIRKIVLFPQRSGELEVDPLEMKFIVQERSSGRSNSMFDQFFGKVKNVEHHLKSKPIKITVKPHPTNKPISFDNAVGQFNMNTSVSSQEIKANEAVNIKVKISGKGNINLIENPEINFPSDFETYDPKINDNISTTASGVSGSREFDFLVIPRHAGTFNIDPITFSFFNPTTKKYKTITSDPIIINVLKGDGSTTDNVTYSSANKEDIQVLGEDIRYIHTNPLKIISKSNFYNTWLFYFLTSLAPLLFIIAFIFRNKIRASQMDVVGNKSRKANKIANKHLATAKKSLTENNTNEFYENISKALFGYTSDKLNIDLADLNKENIAQNLTEVKVSDNTIQQLIDTIDMCDMARFSPVAVSEQEIFSKAESIINKIEEEVKK